VGAGVHGADDGRQVLRIGVVISERFGTICRDLSVFRSVNRGAEQANRGERWPVKAQSRVESGDLAPALLRHYYYEGLASSDPSNVSKLRIPG
jgi:hypothetical protein